MEQIREVTQGGGLRPGWFRRVAAGSGGALFVLVSGALCIGGTTAFLECLVIGCRFFLAPAALLASVIPVRHAAVSALAGGGFAGVGIFALLYIVVGNI